jgi:hypothetical protein
MFARKRPDPDAKLRQLFAEVERLREPFDKRALMSDREAQALMAKINALVERMRAIPATTLGGVFAKLQTAAWLDEESSVEDTPSSRLIAGLLGDLRAAEALGVEHMRRPEARSSFPI